MQPIMKTKPLLILLCAALCTSQASAATILFNLAGRAGVGLLPGNEFPSIGPVTSSGGEVGTGISLDDVTRVLSINVAWGTGQGFTNLTANATAMHIHLAGGPDPQNNVGGVIIGLDGLGGFNSAANNGGFSGNVTLTAAQVTNLFSGALYINVHTAANPGGEIRGNIVPEPSSLTCLSAVGFAFLRRRRR